MLRASDLARRQRGRKMVSSAQGSVYDLGRMFQRLNQRYFAGAIEQPTLTWSQRRTRTILGHHDASTTHRHQQDARDADVPEWFVEYILYHEMLHIKHRRASSRRRYYHTKRSAPTAALPHYRRRSLARPVARQRRTLRARAA